MPKAATLDTIRRALEAVGAVFLSDDDVRLRTAPFEVKTLKLRSSSLHATAAAARGRMSHGSRSRQVNRGPGHWGLWPNRGAQPPQRILVE